MLEQLSGKKQDRKVTEGLGVQHTIQQADINCWNIPMESDMAKEEEWRLFVTIFITCEERGNRMHGCVVGE